MYHKQKTKLNLLVAEYIQITITKMPFEVKLPVLKRTNLFSGIRITNFKLYSKVADTDTFHIINIENNSNTMIQNTSSAH